MSYLNPLYRFGLQELFEQAAAAGIKGMIVPDWPVEEIEPWLPTLDALGLSPILMVTPNTAPERIEKITRRYFANGLVIAGSRIVRKKAAIPGFTLGKILVEKVYFLALHGQIDLRVLPENGIEPRRAGALRAYDKKIGQCH